MTAYVYKLASEHYPWDFAIEFDYSETMVEAIKRCIPSRRRKWVPDLRQWWFQSGCIIDVCVLADKHCGGYVHVGTEPTSPAITTPAAAYTALHLLPTAPPEVVSAAYKALAKKEHPDKGGTVASMQRINRAYELLQTATHSHKEHA